MAAPVLDIRPRPVPVVPRRTVVIEQAQPMDLITVWPFVRRGLVWIKRRQVQQWGDRSTWTPEHVYAVLAAKQGDLWIAVTQDPPHDPVAFTVTQVLIDPFLHVPTGLLVWFAYSDPHKHTDAVAVMDKHLETVARDRGLSYVEALTTRDGLGRRLKSLGWQEVMHVIRKDLY